MRAKILILFAILICLPLSVFSQKQTYGVVDKEVLATMETNYVGLATINVLTGEVDTKATGIAISENCVLTAFHAVHPGHKVVMTYSNGKSLESPYPEGTLSLAFPELDLAIITFTEVKLNPKVHLSNDVSVSQPLYTFTNSAGEEKTFYNLYVSRIEVSPSFINGISNLTFIHVHPGVIAGASGAAVYNERAEIVGMLLLSSEVEFAGSNVIKDSVMIPSQYFAPPIKWVNKNTDPNKEKQK